MYVAVVYKEHQDDAPISHRSEGDWSCFLYPKYQYEVLVGKLTEVAQVPVKYELVKL